MPIDRPPRPGVIAAQGMLQGAAVLPQVGPLGQAKQGVGQQQFATLVERCGTGLQAFDLLVQRCPVGDVGAVGGALEPVPRRLQHWLKLRELGRRAALQRDQGIVERIDHRQQVNHAPAQFTGISQGVRPGTFVAELAYHQFQRVEGGDHGAAHAADIIAIGLARKVTVTVADGFGEPVAGGAYHHRREPARPEDRAHHCRADDAQANLLSPRRGDIEYRRGVVDHGQGDHRQGITGQHQHIVVGSAQVQ